jgi:nucleoid DNA-binding protein
MNFTDKHIIETYANLLEGLSSNNKLEIIENLSKSLKNSIKKKDNAFYASFGAFASTKSAEEINQEIRSSRKFRKKQIKL